MRATPTGWPGARATRRPLIGGERGAWGGGRSRAWGTHSIEVHELVAEEQRARQALPGGRRRLVRAAELHGYSRQIVPCSDHFVLCRRAAVEQHERAFDAGRVVLGL